MNCMYCDQPIVPAQHYIRVALAIDTAGLEYLFDTPSVLAGFEFCTPLCALYWTHSKLPEFMLDNPEIISTFGGRQ